MRLLSKCGLLLIIVGMGIITVETDVGFYVPIFMFCLGGFLYLMFDSDDK